MKMTMKLFGCSAVLAVVGAVFACSPSDGAPGTMGSQGPRGADGLPGSNGSNGSDGLPGNPGRDGVNGEAGVSGEAGSPGLDGSTLCGNLAFPQWNQPCGSDLVGACASTNLTWQCMGKLKGDGSGIVLMLEVCADKTSGVPVLVGSAQSSEYPNNPVAQLPELLNCSHDDDCDGVPDRLTDTVSYTDTHDGTTSVVNVKVGDALTLSAVSGGKVLCQSTSAVCDPVGGHIVAGSWVDAANSANLGLDCFNQSTQLEQAFGCSLDGTTWFGYSDDGDATDTCEVLEGEGQISAGTGQVSCVAPPDVKCFN